MILPCLQICFFSSFLCPLYLSVSVQMLFQKHILRHSGFLTSYNETRCLIILDLKFRFLKTTSRAHHDVASDYFCTNPLLSYQGFCLCIKIYKSPQMKRRKDLFWFKVSKVSVHCQKATFESLKRSNTS